MKKLRHYFLFALSAVAAYLAGSVIFVWATHWVPEQKIMPLRIHQYSTLYTIEDSIVRIATWDVGYGALGEEADFRYDDEGIWTSGNNMVRYPSSLVTKNMYGAMDFLEYTKADFYLLQEVDVSSDRSCRIKQWDTYHKVLTDFSTVFAPDYQCNRVPIPLLEPWNTVGKVYSGLGMLSRYQPSIALRYQLPGQYPLPDRLFQREPCVVMYRFPTRWGNDLVLFNIHHPAYDPGGKMKAIQLPYLHNLAMSEYEKGNYVVIGGAWNQCPPNIRFDAYTSEKTQEYGQNNVPKDLFPEDWRYVYDPKTPNRRKICSPYVRYETFEALTDFFLISPNVRVRKVHGVQQRFRYSDHQPVTMDIVFSSK